MTEPLPPATGLLRVPAGSLIDHRGRPTDDPAVMHEQPFGALLPFGLHKRYALAAMCEIFGGALGVGGHTTHDGIPVDRATWRQIRDSAAALGFADAELDAWTRRCTERA
ncbi:hypothetical protein WL76_32165 [Burkholderia ubonensis]|nr:hypothetical protein WL76_32165 [Burkholderia ubonensis]